MTILSPIKFEHLTVSEYVKMMADSALNDKVVSTKYQINKDWNDGSTGHFIVEYDRPVLREKIL